MSSGPLAGIRVVEFAHWLAGPFCAQLLADAGGDVIKIEPPGGDPARRAGVSRTGEHGRSVSSLAAAVDRGKRSAVLDLDEPDARAAAHELLDSADVVIDGSDTDVLARLGSPLVVVRRGRPRLITVLLSMYGEADPVSPLAGRTAPSLISEGESSLAAMNRDHRGVPVPLGLPLGDMATGLAAYCAIVTALFERERTGVGRHLDLPVVGTLLTLNAIRITGAQITGGSSRVRTTGYGIFPTRDGFVTIGVNNDSLFVRLCEAMQMPELASDPRFASHRIRDANADEGDAIIAGWTSARTTQEVIAAASPSGVPCGTIATPADMLGDRLFRDLRYFQTVDDGVGTRIDTPGNPMGFTRENSAVPRLGQHTDEVLAPRE